MIFWDEFVDFLTIRFGDQIIWDPTARIKKLKQEGSLQRYFEEFDVLLS